MVDPEVVVYGREKAGAELRVFPKRDYMTVVFEQLLTLDPEWLATELQPWDVFETLTPKNLPKGYSPIVDNAARSVGNMFTAMTSYRGVSGSDKFKKKVRYVLNCCLRANHLCTGVRAVLRVHHGT